jgi:hypothetical protein
MRTARNSSKNSCVVVAIDHMRQIGNVKMERYANTCELGAKLDPAARYHAVVCYQAHSGDLAEMISDHLRQVGLSVYFDEIGAGYPGCEGKVYDIAYHLYSKQANYLVELWSVPTRDSDETAKVDAACWTRNGNYPIPIRVADDVLPTEDVVYLDAVLLGMNAVFEALAIELVMLPSESNRARIERFEELYREEGEDGEAILRLLERKRKRERERM